MHRAVDLLAASMTSEDPKQVYSVTTRAIASELKVIARADDSSGIIGDACRRLLALHPVAADTAKVPASVLVKWMLDFQFHSEVDYFTLDPVAYAPALGVRGMDRYRVELSRVAAGRGARPPEADRWSSPHPHEWFVLGWNEQRLAVLDRDIEAIIRTHARERRVAAWLHDAAEAFEEIGEIDLAIDWARQAAEFDKGHQAKRAAGYLAKLLAAHRPKELLPERLAEFRCWPNASTAAYLHAAAADAWPDYADVVEESLAPYPREAVLFILLTLQDASRAWQRAHDLALADKDCWARLVQEYEKVDALAVLPIQEQLVRGELMEADAKQYRSAAIRLDRMRAIAAATAHAPMVDGLITELRQGNRHRPRMQCEFDRVGLPSAGQP